MQHKIGRPEQKPHLFDLIDVGFYQGLDQT